MKKNSIIQCRNRTMNFYDLKSPFNSIIGFSNLLVEQVKNKDIEGIDKYAKLS